MAEGRVQRRFVVIAAALVVLVASGCDGGRGVPTSFYVDVARSLSPALGQAGEERTKPLAELRQHANEGDTEARYRLGELLYGQGQRSAGRRSMCLAAKQGLGKAMAKLGYWSEHDETALVRAVAWYSLAEKHGHPWAKKYRARLWNKLNPDQRTAAKELEPALEAISCDTVN
jgi:TPR repeat protein